MSDVLSIEGLSVEYRTAKGISHAVTAVDLNLPEGSITGLVGESGCGKTTLSRALIRVLPENGRIAAGHIRYRQHDLATASEEEMRALRWREIALVPQSAMNSLDPVYRVGDQFVELLQLRAGMSRAQARSRTEELFTMVGLDPARMRSYPHEYSGGMKQRAVIAMALALHPQVVIADEPVTALDVLVQHQVLRELRRLQQEMRLAMIFVTHDMAVVAELCDRVAVMYAGQLIETGDVRQVLKRPFHPYTMGLTNSFPSILHPEKQLVSIEGYPPDLVEPPPGCRFAARCPFAEARCSREVPALQEVEPGHGAACLRADTAEILRERAKEAVTWQRTPTISS